jgi:hypothetical protein
MTTIRPMPVGFGDVYAVQDEGVTVVDAGDSRSAQKFAGPFAHQAASMSQASEARRPTGDKMSTSLSKRGPPERRYPQSERKRFPEWGARL